MQTQVCVLGVTVVYEAIIAISKAITRTAFILLLGNKNIKKKILLKNGGTVIKIDSAFAYPTRQIYYIN